MHSSATIFNFSTFVSALALLLIVYTLAGVRYQFRVKVTRVPILGITYLAIIIIGFLTLFLTLISYYLGHQIAFQIILGAGFLMLILVWIGISFIFTPKFNKNNSRKFFSVLEPIILNGSDKELPFIADELGRSASSIVKIGKHELSKIKDSKKEADKQKN
jgi:hypothetical protein